MSLLLTFSDPAEITLPRRLAWGPLTLSEIGAVVFLASASMTDNTEESTAASQRLHSPDLIQAIQSLKDKGVIRFDPVRNSLDVHLDPIMPPDAWFTAENSTI